MPLIRDRTLEGLFDHLTGTLDDLPRPFCCTNRDVLAGRRSTFPNGSGGIDRMKSNQVSGALTGALSKVARTLTGTFPDITTTTSDIATGASTLFLCGGLARRLICRWSRSALAVGRKAECKQS